ncbi:hypothetical protein, partial [Chryseobacterium sp. CH25]|uniref:hypothetical protein n=1 Tax=Chryseobacterium sp. CH25 TaxID=713559 RepID=UPI0010276AAC
TRGGDPSKSLVGELNLDQTNPKINISSWQNSSTPANAVLVEFGNANVDNDIDTSESNKNFSRKLSFKTRGGDPSKSLVGELNLDQTNPKINISSWQNSS